MRTCKRPCLPNPVFHTVSRDETSQNLQFLYQRRTYSWPVSTAKLQVSMNYVILECQEGTSKRLRCIAKGSLQAR